LVYELAYESAYGLVYESAYESAYESVYGLVYEESAYVLADVVPMPPGACLLQPAREGIE
jgi:hypothetical protein